MLFKAESFTLDIINLYSKFIKIYQYNPEELPIEKNKRFYKKLFGLANAVIRPWITSKLTKFNIVSKYSENPIQNNFIKAKTNIFIPPIETYIGGEIYYENKERGTLVNPDNPKANSNIEWIKNRAKLSKIIREFLKERKITQTPLPESASSMREIPTLYEKPMPVFYKNRLSNFDINKKIPLYSFDPK